MANVYLDDTTLTAIANAIRAKTGGSSPITPANMDDEIASITTGGSGPITVTLGGDMRDKQYLFSGPLPEELGNNLRVVVGQNNIKGAKTIFANTSFVPSIFDYNNGNYNTELVFDTDVDGGAGVVSSGFFKSYNPNKDVYIKKITFNIKNNLNSNFFSSFFNNVNDNIAIATPHYINIDEIVFNFKLSTFLYTNAQYLTAFFQSSVYIKVKKVIFNDDSVDGGALTLLLQGTNGLMTTKNNYGGYTMFGNWVTTFNKNLKIEKLIFNLKPFTTQTVPFNGLILGGNIYNIVDRVIFNIPYNSEYENYDLIIGWEKAFSDYPNRNTQSTFYFRNKQKIKFISSENEALENNEIGIFINTDPNNNVTIKHRRGIAMAFYYTQGFTNVPDVWNDPNTVWDDSCVSTDSYDSVYSGTSLIEDPVIPVPTTNTVRTANILINTIGTNNGMKSLKFIPSAQTVSWKSQLLDITAGAKTYYGHDEVLATINSLPDTSAYLATAGGTNTFKVYGGFGGNTTGGTVNTLTAAEIAVATAKGWTVTIT